MEQVSSLSGSGLVRLRGAACPCGQARVWVLDQCLLSIPATHHGAQVSPSVSVSTRSGISSANEAHSNPGLVREVRDL